MKNIEIDKVIEQLPIALRKAIWLYYVEKKSKAEISRRLNISLPKARNRIAKGMFLLKQKMKNEELMNAYKMIYPLKTPN